MSKERTVWINRKSGCTHLFRDCESIVNIPDEMLRTMDLYSRKTPRVCQFCAVRSIDG